MECARPKCRRRVGTVGSKCRQAYYCTEQCAERHRARHEKHCRTCAYHDSGEGTVARMRSLSVSRCGVAHDRSLLAVAWHDAEVGPELWMTKTTAAVPRLELRGVRARGIVRLLAWPRLLDVELEDWIITGAAVGLPLGAHSLARALVAYHRRCEARDDEDSCAHVRAFFRRWIELYGHEDFASDDAMAEHARALLSDADAALAWAARPPAPVVADAPAPMPLLPLNAVTLVPALADMSEVELARQLALYEHANFFTSTPRTEWVAYARHNDTECAPHVHALVDSACRTAYWVAAEVLRAEVPRDVYMYWVRVMRHCLDIHNVSGAMHIHTGLMHTSVARLRLVPEVVAATATPPPLARQRSRLFRRHRKSSGDGRLVECMTTLADAARLFDMTNNCATLRRHMDNDVCVPCMPYVGLFVRDLKFALENPDTIEVERGPTLGTRRFYNMHKTRIVADILQRLRAYQRTAYNYVEVSTIQEYIVGQSTGITVDELYARSNFLLPSRRTAGASSCARTDDARRLPPPDRPPPPPPLDDEDGVEDE